MRSINTSLIALLPVAGLLFVGAGILGVGTIKDLALVQSSAASGRLVDLHRHPGRLASSRSATRRTGACAKRVATRQGAGGEGRDPRPARPAKQKAVAGTGATRRGATAVSKALPGDRGGHRRRRAGQGRRPRRDRAGRDRGAGAEPGRGPGPARRGRVPARASALRRSAAAAAGRRPRSAGDRSGRAGRRAVAGTCPTSRCRASCSRT